MAKPKPSAKQSLAARLAKRLNKLTPLDGEGCADADAAAILDATVDLTQKLVHAPSLDIDDIEHKLALLCRRLRADIGTAYRDEWLTYLLAESIRDDLCRLRDL